MPTPGTMPPPMMPELYRQPVRGSMVAAPGMPSIRTGGHYVVDARVGHEQSYARDDKRHARPAAPSDQVVRPVIPSAAVIHDIPILPSPRRRQPESAQNAHLLGLNPRVNTT
jgi:hypothetical protein